MIYGSVCSGIEAATVAWEPLGWQPAWFSEIDKFPGAVLRHHYPQVPNLGDMTKLNEHSIYNDTAIDLLCGGTPCQSFSIAGLRAGLADPRGNLTLEFLRICATKQPKWVIWENVPGVLSDKTNAFGKFIAGLGQCGYSIAYRVLDAQYFGVPQRRRRVFVVGYLGNDWRPPFAVLFEPDSLQRDITPRKSKKKVSAGNIDTNINGTIGTLTQRGDESAGEIANRIVYASSIDCRNHTVNAVSTTLQAKEGIGLNHINPIYVATLGQSQQNGLGIFETQTANTLEATSIGQAVIYDPATMFINDMNPQPGDPCHTLRATSHIPLLIKQVARRLTPLECERLQGFPDNYTNIPYKVKLGDTLDAKQYKALGNSMAVPVMRWIGQRINNVNNILEHGR